MFPVPRVLPPGAPSWYASSIIFPFGFSLCSQLTSSECSGSIGFQMASLCSNGYMADHVTAVWCKTRQEYLWQHIFIFRKNSPCLLGNHWPHVFLVHYMAFVALIVAQRLWRYRRFRQRMQNRRRQHTRCALQTAFLRILVLPEVRACISAMV